MPGNVLQKGMVTQEPQIHFLIQSFNKYLLCAYHMPGTVPGIGDKAM